MTGDDTPRPPAALEPVAEGGPDALEDRVAAGPLLVATDFDGTLAEIVEQPEDARPRADARDALARLAAGPDVQVAVVSGRGLADLRDRVGLDGVAYAGNHGLEIVADGRERIHPAAEDARGDLEAVLDRVDEAVGDVDGARIEDKSLTATVHYRTVTDPDAEDRVRETVLDAVADHGGLEHTSAKRAVEVRPTVDWDKGRAIEWLLDEVAPAGATPLYVGDDETDEDGFQAIGDDGVTVRVGGGETAAAWRVPDPAAVASLFEWLAAVRTAP